MAIVAEKIKDTTTTAVFKLLSYSNAGSETNVKKIDASTLSGAIGSELLSITKIAWAVKDCSVKITFDGATDKDALILSYANDIDFTKNAWSIPDTSITPVGDILLSTLDYTTTSTYCIIIEIKKISGYTMVTN